MSDTDTQTTSLHQQLMDTAYNRWNAELKNCSKIEFFDSLSAQERFAVHTGNLNYQVENGGFSQWGPTCNNYGTPETCAYLLRALDRVGTPTAASVKLLLTKAQDAWKGYNPNKYREEDEDDEVFVRLNELDTEYYEVNEQFMRDCEAHLQKGAW